MPAPSNVNHERDNSAKAAEELARKLKPAFDRAVQEHGGRLPNDGERLTAQFSAFSFRVSNTQTGEAKADMGVIVFPAKDSSTAADLVRQALSHAALDIDESSVTTSHRLRS